MMKHKYYLFVIDRVLERNVLIVARSLKSALRKLYRHFPIETCEIINVKVVGQD